MDTDSPDQPAKGYAMKLKNSPNRLSWFTKTIFIVVWSTVVSAQTPLKTTLVADGYSSPVFLTSPTDDTTRLFIVEQNSGKVKIIKNGVPLSRPFLDISDRVGSNGFEQGLFSLAFHPEYSSNGKIFVNYTDASGNLKISRYLVSTDPDSADAETEAVLLTITQPESNHNGGTVLFNPYDGLLYITTGDGGGSGDNHGDTGNSQDTSSLLGKVLRIDVDGGGLFALPPDNPFIDEPGRDEIWSFGLRNPWRVSFDRATGDFYIADVGQNNWEEINFQSANSTGGENYGWRLKEGNHCFNPSTNCDPGGLTDPLTEYSSNFGCSIIGGYVYRGCLIPDLQGTYFYADWCSGSIWSFRYDGSVMTDSTNRTSELAPGSGLSIDNPSSFGEDANGNIYIIDYEDGEIYRIDPAEPVASDCNQEDCCLNPGDANRDGLPNVGDAVYLINYVFKAGPGPICPDEGDANFDCSANVGDAVYLINFVFKNGPPPQCGSCNKNSIV